jgi:tRNA-dihydrouridine synthase B
LNLFVPYDTMNRVNLMSFKIGNLVIENKIILAPMAGVSNSPFRVLSRRYGAGLVFAEMVSDKGLLYNNEKTIKLLYMTDVEKPMAQQIFGSDLKTMVEAAVYIDKNSNADIIDINMGCPVPKVAIKAQAGSALMKNPDLIYDIVSEIVKRVSKPVTVKIRSGWDHSSVNAVEVAKRIEAAGAAAITVHARTRSQGYSGLADYDVIKAVKEAVKIPVIGNGDVIDGPSAKRMLEHTGCDAVMIGRGALGNPWIFREIDAYLKDGTILERPSHEEIREMMVSHLDSLVELKGEHIAVLEMRSHGPWYLKGIEHATQLRKQLSQTKTRNEFVNLVNAFFK